MKIVADIQFFRTSEQILTPKEIAVFDGVRAAHYLFKPLFPFRELSSTLKRQAQWIMSHHHTIDWNKGHVPAYQCKPIFHRLLRNADVVYVKGREKAEFVRKLVGANVLKLVEEPGLSKMEPSCFYHMSSNCVCALSNLYFLYSKLRNKKHF